MFSRRKLQNAKGHENKKKGNVTLVIDTYEEVSFRALRLRLEGITSFRDCLLIFCQKKYEFR